MSNPQTTLDWSFMWCSRHLEPLRESWPAGAAQAMLGLFNAACEDDRLHAETGGKTENIESALKNHAPVCCWLEKGKAEEVINLALEGKIYGLEKH